MEIGRLACCRHWVTDLDVERGPGNNPGGVLVPKVPSSGLTTQLTMTRLSVNDARCEALLASGCNHQTPRPPR